jgi:glycosyltransferase involved in cell wall biosynthesis
MITVLIILSSLDYGGAERQLINLLQGLNKKKFKPIVVTYYCEGKWEEAVKNIPGVVLTSLSMKGRFDLFRMFTKGAFLIRKYHPHILYGLFGDSCTLAFFLGKLFRKRIIWGLRTTNLNFKEYSVFSRMVYKLNALLSRWVDRIICNSWSSVDYHSSLGYKRRNMVVIPNGIDTSFFRHRFSEGKTLKESWGLPSDACLIGRVGRLDQMKDYNTFLTAAAIVSEHKKGVYFVIVGGGSRRAKAYLLNLSLSLGIADHIIWLGSQENLSPIYSAFTISCSSSFGESFPNVIAESLACEIPCVATDVGDSVKVLGPGGIIVPPKNPYALAEAFEKMLSLSEKCLRNIGKEGRNYICEKFGIEKMVRDTENILIFLIAR